MATTAGSPSSSSSSSAATTTTTTMFSAVADPNPNPNPNPPNSDPNPNSSQSWWESISKARSRIHALATLLSLPSLSSLADSDRPARSLLESPSARAAVSSALSLPSSGSGADPLCHWLYDTFLSADPDLCLVVLSFLPLVSGVYLSRVLSPDPPSLAGLEAVLLAVYGSETQSRNGKPLLVSVPDLSLPSLYHSPTHRPPTAAPPAPRQLSVGILSPPLEPHRVVKSTKRATIVGVVFECYYKKISLMPSQSKADLCHFVASWAGRDCSCRHELDELNSLSPDEVELGRLEIGEKEEGTSRVPLPWELLQPLLRILGHCLLAPLNPQEVRDAASVAVRAVYARASHDLLPQAILAARSLIQLDKGARKSAKEAAITSGTPSNPNTPSKPKKPEVFLVSK